MKYFYMILMFMLSAGQVLAHELDKVVQQTHVFIGSTYLTVQYDTVYSTLLTHASLLKLDKDENRVYSLQEKRAFLKELSEEINKNLIVTLDGTQQSLVYSYGTIRDVHEDHLVTEMVFGIAFDELADGPHDFRLVDTNVPAAVLGDMLFEVETEEGLKVIETVKEKQSLLCRFEVQLGRETVSEPVHRNTMDRCPPAFDQNSHFQSATDSSLQKDMPAETAMRLGLPGNESSGIPQESVASHSPGNKLLAIVKSDNHSIAFVFTSLVTALFLGAFHALSPGHGKAMVAAYLVGTRSSIRDAVILGCTVTLTHISSVVLLGIIMLVCSQFFLPQQLYPVLGAVSGMLIVLIGFRMMVKSASGSAGHSHHHHHHHHDHHHDHNHDHNHEDSHGHRHDHDYSNGNDHSHPHPSAKKSSLWSIIGLGISGGMVPCPSALVILLAAVAMHRVAFGLGLIAAFSLGLAGVLIVISIIVLKSSRHIVATHGRKAWLQKLPIVTSFAIIAIGTMILLNAVLL